MARSASSALAVTALLMLLAGSCGVVVLGQQARNITITNQCATTQFWFKATTGAIPASPTCSSSSDCPSGSSCSSNICYFNVPPTSSGVYSVASGGGTNTLMIPYNDIGGQTWSGNVGFCQSGTCGSFAADQTGANCDTGGCNNAATGPCNLAEITMLTSGADAYDISNIPGNNVLMSFGPVLTTATYSDSAPYTCGTPGSTSGTYPSPWSFAPPSPYNVYVVPGGASCSTNSDCSGGQECGLSNNAGSFQLQCGTRIGHWTPNGVCALDSGISGAPFDCNLALPAPNSGSTESNLLGCDSALDNSCYTSGATTSCCGCANWQDSGLLGSAVPSSTETCVAENPNWTQYVLPQLQWMKAGAPSAYVYPFDDMSSSFTCSQADSSGTNAINYNIVLCP